MLSKFFILNLRYLSLMGELDVQVLRDSSPPDESETRSAIACANTV